MTRVFVGIDPGLTGAVAVIVEDPARIEVYDTPVVAVKRGHDYLVASMRELLDFPDDYQVMAALEQGIAMPRQSAPSTWKNGRGLGLWEGLLAGHEIPYELVMPMRWKRALGIAKGAPKTESRMLAQRLFPQVAESFARAKDDGRAEALLIAEWRRRQG